MENPYLSTARDEETLAYELRSTPDEAIAKLASGSYKLVKKTSGAKRKRFTAKDDIFLGWLYKFKLATATDLSVVARVKPETAYKRFLGLEGVGLVKRLPVWNAETQWTLTREGARYLGDTRWTTRTLPESILHTKVVNHVAANLAAGNHTVLGLPPRVFITDTSLGMKWLTSEFEIQRSLGYVRQSMKKDELRTMLRREYRERMSAWWQANGALPYPVWERGEEWQAAIIPPFNKLGAYHVPDLVLRRTRYSLDYAADVAIEVETSVKKERDYRRIMDVYRSDFFSRAEPPLYSSVVWLCRHSATYSSLSTMAEKMGLLGTKVVVEWVRDSEGNRAGADWWKY